MDEFGGPTQEPATTLREVPTFDLDFEIDVNTAPMTITIRPPETSNQSETAWISCSVIHTVPLDDTR